MNRARRRLTSVIEQISMSERRIQYSHSHIVTVLKSDIRQNTTYRTHSYLNKDDIYIPSKHDTLKE